MNQTGQNTIITDVLQLMGLTAEEGCSFIPIANDENKRMVEQVNLMMKAKTDKTVIVNYYNGRLLKLRESFKGVELEFEQNLVRYYIVKMNSSIFKFHNLIFLK